MNESIDYNLFTFNGAVASEHQPPTLGDLLVGNAYDQVAFSGDAAILAWNLTIASLLGRAADQEREKRTAHVEVQIKLEDIDALLWPSMLAHNLGMAGHMHQMLYDPLGAEALRKQNATTQVLLP